MAAIIPNLNTVRTITPGERRFGRRLEALLEDDYTVWYDIPIGRTRRYPDFIILHPSRGLLFLEVKDWKPQTLKQLSSTRFVLETGKGRETVANPLEQARQYAFATVDMLKEDAQLVSHSGPYQGKLAFPYGYGVVFTNITRKQWNKGIADVAAQERIIPPHRVIFQDEMTESVDAEAFQSRLWGMFEYTFGGKLTLPQIDRIRWHLFPEVRIDAPQQDLFDEQEADEEVDATPLAPPAQTIPEIVRVIDIQQEQLAKSLGEGHRVIHGVAGSGKTLILGYRCLHLAQATTKPILVLCFNIALAARLRGFIAEKGLEEKVQVYHFHEWCGLQLKTYNVDTIGGDKPHWERQVDSVIQGVEAGLIPRAQYGALMIDEGHDFEKEWLALIVQMIDPNTDSLLLLYDDAQSIYSRNSLKFSLSSAGIQARGRTTILRLNYRNTREILTFAYDFAREYITAQEADDDHVPLIEPQVAGANGPPPAYRQFNTAKEEANYIARCVAKWQKDGQPLNEIAIIYSQHWQAEPLAAALAAAGVPGTVLRTNKDKKAYDPAKEQVTLLTRHSSKGLEFNTVVLTGLGALKDDEDHLAQETRLLYVGMTRARQQLLVTSSGLNRYTERLATLVEKVA